MRKEGGCPAETLSTCLTRARNVIPAPTDQEATAARLNTPGGARAAQHRVGGILVHAPTMASTPQAAEWVRSEVLRAALGWGLLCRWSLRRALQQGGVGGPPRVMRTEGMVS